MRTSAGSQVSGPSTAPAPATMRALEYAARRAMKASSDAIEATQQGTPSRKAKTWRIGQGPSDYSR